MTFYEVPGTGISTGVKDIAQAHSERGFDVRTTAVPTVPLSEILEQFSGRDIHWMKIDVEGMEGEVLESWSPSRQRPWIVVVESVLPMSQTQCHHDWEPGLLARGYRFAYFDGLNRYYVRSERNDLAEALHTGPNIFDGFSLSGIASEPFSTVLRQEVRSVRDEASVAQAQVQDPTRPPAESTASARTS